MGACRHSDDRLVEGLEVVGVELSHLAKLFDSSLVNQALSVVGLESFGMVLERVVLCVEVPGCGKPVQSALDVVESSRVSILWSSRWRRLMHCRRFLASSSLSR